LNIYYIYIKARARRERARAPARARAGKMDTKIQKNDFKAYKMKRQIQLLKNDCFQI